MKVLGDDEMAVGGRPLEDEELLVEYIITGLNENFAPYQQPGSRQALSATGEPIGPIDLRASPRVSYFFILKLIVWQLLKRFGEEKSRSSPRVSNKWHLKNQIWGPHELCCGFFSFPSRETTGHAEP